MKRNPLQRGRKRSHIPRGWQATIGESAPAEILHQPTLLLFKSLTQNAVVTRWESSHGLVLAVMFRNRDGDRVTGSAVLVAPGIALTAFHVLEDEMTALAERSAEMVLLGSPGPGRLTVWWPLSVTHIGETDLALVAMTPIGGVLPVMRYATLTARTPVSGETVTICGFRALKYDFAISDPKELRLLTATGQVDQIWPKGRDRLLVPWPAYDVHCFQPSGVSGGAVFDQSGRLLGMFSRSLDAMSGEMAGPSYVAMLRGPFFMQPVPITWPREVGMRSLAELTLERMACIDGVRYKFDPVTGGKQFDW